MKASNDTPYHDSTKRHAIVLVNHGTPDSPTYFAVQRYLREFLSDPKVVKSPRWFWLPLLYLVILPFRPFLTKNKYQRIWTDQGSPFQIYHQSLVEALEKHLNQNKTDRYIVKYAMRYGNPSIKAVTDELLALKVNSISCLPLFPQYSESMTGSIFKRVTQLISRWIYIPKFNIKLGYHDQTVYIAAIAASIERYWSQNGRGEVLVMSFHSLPQKTLPKGDPYYCLCQKTGRLIAERLELTESDYKICFQSRFGREPWLQPYTQDTLFNLSKEGVINIDIVCPGFSIDCLETIDEIDFELQEELKEENISCQLNYIPALNDTKYAVELYADLLDLSTGKNK